MKRLLTGLACALVLMLANLHSSSAAAFFAPAPSSFGWANTWGGSNAIVIAKSVRVDAAGNIYTVGEFRGTVNFDPAGPNQTATITSLNGTTDAFLTKFDSSGNFKWARTWGSGPTGGNIQMGFGRDAANALDLDASGNLYVAGLYQSTVDFGSGFTATSNAAAGYNNIFLAGLAADGTTQWVRTWGGATGGEAYSIAVDRTRGYVYVEGDWSTNPNTGTVDFNPIGPAHDLHANHGFYDAFLSKYSLNGDFQWARTWGGEGYDDGPGVAVDGNGNVYVGGMYGSQTINFDPAGGNGGLGHPATNASCPYTCVDVFLSKFDANGTFQWVRTWGGLDKGGNGTVNAGEMVAADRANNVYIIGRFGCDNCDFNAGPTGDPDPHSSRGDLDAFVSKYSADGHFLWAKSWGGAGKDGAGGLGLDGLSNVYVGGMFSDSADLGNGLVNSQGQLDISFTKFSSAGIFQWVQIWGGPGNDINWGMIIDSVDAVYACGSFQNTVDFDPGTSTVNQTAAGIQSAFLSKFINPPVVWQYKEYFPAIIK